MHAEFKDFKSPLIVRRTMNRYEKNGLKVSGGGESSMNVEGKRSKM